MTDRESDQTMLSRIFLILGSVVRGTVRSGGRVFPAPAQKETFERSKPHVNVGTVGSGGSSPSQKICCGEANSGASDDPDKKEVRRSKGDTDAGRRDRR